METAVGRGAGGSLVRNGRGVRADRTSVGRDVRVVAVDLALEAAVGRGAGGSLVRDGRGVRADRTSIGRDVRVIAVDLTLEAAVGRGAVCRFLSGHHSQAVGFGLWRAGRKQSDRGRCHGHGPEQFESIATVDFDLEGETTCGPIHCCQTFRTLDTADGEVDQAESIGHDPIVGLRPDGGVGRIRQSKANVQGCIFQSIAVRIAGNGLVGNPVALLGLSGESRQQHHCGQEERAHQIHLG